VIKSHDRFVAKIQQVFNLYNSHIKISPYSDDNFRARPIYQKIIISARIENIELINLDI